MKPEALIFFGLFFVGPGLVCAPLAFFLFAMLFSSWRERDAGSFVIGWCAFVLVDLAAAAFGLWHMLPVFDKRIPGDGPEAATSALMLFLIVPIASAVLGLCIGLTIALLYHAPTVALPGIRDDLFRQRLYLLLGLATGIGLLSWFVGSSLR